VYFFRFKLCLTKFGIAKNLKTKIMKIKITLSLLLAITSFYSNCQTAIKRVVVEENTGTWCSSCAYGSVYFKHVKENYPNAIPIANHNGSFNGEPMAVWDDEIYFLDYYSGSPTFLFDRTDFPENSQSKAGISASNTWAHGLDTLDYYMDKVYNQAPLATVGVDRSYDEGTRLVTVTITANFVENATGNFKLNCFVVEDSVTGGSDYDQANSNFSGSTSAPAYLQELVDLPASIVGYSHGHVMRTMLGTPSGADAGIPTTVSSGASYSKEFTYTVPDGFDPDQISLVGVIQRYGPDKLADRQIVNANSVHLLASTSGIQASNKNVVEMNVYPNPITDNSVVEFYLKNSGHVFCSLYNIQGQLIKEIFNENLTQGEYRIDINSEELNEGVYILKFSQDGRNQIKKIIKE
jgi:hypothetical protein